MDPARIEDPARLRTVDQGIAASVAALYCVLVAALLPAELYLRTLGGGLLVFGIVAAAAHWVGHRGVPGMSVLIVGIAAGALLWMPTFPAMGGKSRAAIYLGFLGMQAAMLLWVALTWSPPLRRSPHRSLLSAYRWALLMALGLSVIATVGVGLGVAVGGPRARAMLLVYPAYFAGALAAATLYWLLQRITDLGTGRYLLGMLGGTCVYGAVAPIVSLTDGDRFRLGPMAATAIVCGSLVGPAVAVGFGHSLDTPSKYQLDESLESASRKRRRG